MVEPTSSGIGGGAFWLLHRASDGFQTMVDAREQAPAAAHRDMYLDENGEVNRDLAINGPLAGGIPGEIAGLEHLATHYGKLPLSVSLQPAIRIAREVFEVDKKFNCGNCHTTGEKPMTRNDTKFKNFLDYFTECRK